jgi:hypothetical protein
MVKGRLVNAQSEAVASRSERVDRLVALARVEKNASEDTENIEKVVEKTSSYHLMRAAEVAAILNIRRGYTSRLMQ